MKKSILPSIIFLALSTGLYAQNVAAQTIRWQVAKTQEINTGRVSDDPDLIVSYGATRSSGRMPGAW